MFLEGRIANLALLRWMLTVDYVSPGCGPSPSSPMSQYYWMLVVFGPLCSQNNLVNITRPDLAFAYSQLSKFVQYPGVVHLQVAERVLQYVCGTYDQGITD